MREAMGRAALLAVAFLLAGCEPATRISTGKFVLPRELSDCQFFDMYDGNRNVLVVRCPHSDASASHLSGKINHRTVTVEE
ncbi:MULTISPECIES: hypothetical protein [unclassified Aeromonas]|uniref:hypothetical protein n=1 Tax=unclassified Aeromonas TaxID=257493 RepID=UPI0022E6FE8C|nr:MULTISPECIES: hypothetical protein [unclassified Aeromonas]